MSNPQCYYMDDSGQQTGPVSFDELRQLASNGAIKMETFVWAEGMPEWTAASGMAGLFPDEVVKAASQWYYLDALGQQIGPVLFASLQQLAADGTIQASTMVWSAGMENWSAASAVGGLIPTGKGAGYSVTVPVRLIQAPARPGAASGRPTLLTGRSAAAPAQPVPALAQAVASPGQPVATPYAEQTKAPEGGEYPIPFVKRASYGIFAGLYGGGILMMLVGFFISRNQERAMVSLGVSGLGLILLMAGSAMMFIYLYRAWVLLQPGGASTTPGKAVGFLFIPFFCIYWVFIALAKWPKDWNRIVSSHPNLAGAPRASEKLFLFWAILLLVPFLFPVALVAMFLAVRQMGNSINFMHDLKTTQEMKQQGQGQGQGIKLY